MPRPFRVLLSLLLLAPGCRGSSPSSSSPPDLDVAVDLEARAPASDAAPGHDARTADGSSPPDAGLEARPDAADGAADAGPADAGPGDGGPADAGRADGGADPGSADTGMPDAAGPGDASRQEGADASGDLGPGAPDAQAAYRPGSLASCWTEAGCRRVMAVAHGGAWDLLSLPYDSNGAIANASSLGSDGVKVDVRVTRDDVPVIAHSSPIEFYESLDCGGRRIEEMTAAEVTGCHPLPSLTETFQTLEEVLNLVRGEMVVQLCVKESADLGRTIVEIHAQSAEDFAFIELSKSDLQDLVPDLEGSDGVWYLVNVESALEEVDELIDGIRNPRAFMYEFDTTVDLSSLAPERLHPAGIRTFTYDKSLLLSVEQIQAYFEGGFDVVSTQAVPNAVQARRLVNAARGVAPP